ncbi:MAG TPA: hypothetical protein VEK08_25665 [Planctomycetota bacterium]|nr:hypothetical protein [Planctomycetota bacterium]
MSEVEPQVQAIAPAKKESRLRFSLATLLAATVAAGAFMMWLRAQSDIRELKTVLAERDAENRKMRTELGVLQVDDRGSVYVCTRKTLEDLRWSWRVYIPATARYRVRILTSNIPVSGFSEESNSTWIGDVAAGEFTIDAAVNRTARGDWRIIFSMPGSSVSSTFPPETKWLSGGTGYSINTGGVEQRKLKPSERIELLRIREMVRTSPTQAQTTTDPSAGVLIWIERDDLPRGSK